MTLANGASAWEPTLNLFGVLCLYSVLGLDASELGGGTGPSESGVLGAEEGKEGERNAWRTPGEHLAQHTLSQAVQFGAFTLSPALCSPVLPAAQSS